MHMTERMIPFFQITNSFTSVIILSQLFLRLTNDLKEKWENFDVGILP